MAALAAAAGCHLVFSQQSPVKDKRYLVVGTYGWQQWRQFQMAIPVPSGAILGQMIGKVGKKSLFSVPPPLLLINSFKFPEKGSRFAAK